MAPPGQLLDLRNVSVLDVIGLFGGLWVLGEIRPSSGATTWQSTGSSSCSPASRWSSGPIRPLYDMLVAG